MKIIIIEDDPNVREDLQRLLENASYEVTAITDFENTASQILSANADLALLDIHLPNQNGQQICSSIRRESDIPIIFLTSDDNVMTELDSMLMGGDDYITKPYHPSLLLARITAILKRTQKSTPADDHIFTHRGLSLDTSTYKISYNGAQTELSKNECKLLHYLMTRKGEVIPRLDIIEHLWDNEVFIDDNALSVNITRLRTRLESLGLSSFIETKRGVGYQI